MKNTAHPLVALKLSRTVADVLGKARQIVQAMTGNSFFPKPSPTLATVTQHADALDAAETAAKSRTKGLAEARDVALDTLLTDLHHLADYVQAIADNDVGQARAIIESAAMSVREHGRHQKAALEATMGPGGIVRLRALSAGRGSAYEWQQSTDAGKTWTALPLTTIARTTVAGLATGASVQFRVRPTTSAGQQDWTDPVTFTVH